MPKLTTVYWPWLPERVVVVHIRCVLVLHDHSLEIGPAFGFFELRSSTVYRWYARTGIICYLPTLAATRAEAHKATYLPGGVNRDHSCGARQARRHDRADARQPAAAHLEARERLRATCARAAGRASRLTQTGLCTLAFTPPLLSHLATYLPTY